MLCLPEHVAARARIKCCFWGAASADHRYQNLDLQDEKMHLNCKDEVLASVRQTCKICCLLKSHTQWYPNLVCKSTHMCTDVWDSWCFKLHFISRHWAAYFAWDLAPLERTLEEARGDGDSERSGKGGAKSHHLTLTMCNMYTDIRFYDTLCVTSTVDQKDPQWSREASTIYVHMRAHTWYDLEAAVWPNVQALAEMEKYLTSEHYVVTLYTARAPGDDIWVWSRVFFILTYPKCFTMCVKQDCGIPYVGPWWNSEPQGGGTVPDVLDFSLPNPATEAIHFDLFRVSCLDHGPRLQPPQQRWWSVGQANFQLLWPVQPEVPLGSKYQVESPGDLTVTQM